MKCHIKETQKSKIYHELRETAIIPEDFIEGENGTRFLGLRAYELPIGKESFVMEWLETNGDRVFDHYMCILTSSLLKGT